MKIMVGALMVVAFLVLMMCLAAMTRGGRKKSYLFEAKKVMSAPEQVLYLRLLQALPEHVVLAQVGMSRVIEPRRGQQWIAAFRSISQKSLDFVVCTSDCSIIAAIELDDASHNRKDRQRSDQVKDEALKSAGVRIIRWNVKNIPEIHAIQEEVLGHANKLQQKRRA